MKSEFIHIGFSKSASTYLQSIFQNTPGINYSYKSGKFNKDNVQDNVTETQSDLIQLESDEHIVLPEWHPTLHRVRVTRLGILTEVFSRIIERSKQPKIILVIRNQYQLIISRYSQYVVGSGGKLDFDSFFHEMVSGDEIFYDNKYHKIFHLLAKSFSVENVHVIVYEEIKLRGSEIIEELNTFTGLTFKYEPAKFKSKRKGLSKRAMNWVRILNTIAVQSRQPEKSKVRTRFPKLLYISLIRMVRILDGLYPGKKLTLTQKQYQKLIEVFSKDNELLAKSLGKNMSELGYQ